MKALGREDRVAIRFSFSKWNTEQEVDRVVVELVRCLGFEAIERGQASRENL